MSKNNVFLKTKYFYLFPVFVILGILATIFSLSQPRESLALECPTDLPGPDTCISLYGHPANTYPRVGNLNCQYDDFGAKSCTYTLPYPYQSAYPNRGDTIGAIGHILQAYDRELGQSQYIRRVNGFGNENLILNITEQDFANACRNHPGETLTVVFANVLRYDAACGVKAYYANSGGNFCGNTSCSASNNFGGFGDEMTCKNSCCNIPSPYNGPANDLSVPNGLEVQRQCGLPPTCTTPVPNPYQVTYAPGSVISVSGNGSGSSGELTYTWDATVGGVINQTGNPAEVNFTFPNLRGVSPEVRYKVSDLMGESEWCSVTLSTSSCGDGFLDPEYETCESDSQCLPGEVCQSCNCEPFNSNTCGDGVVQDPEECDDGNNDNNDYCNNICRLNPLGCDDGTNACVFVTDPALVDPTCGAVGESCGAVTPTFGSVRGTVSLYSEEVCSSLGSPLSSVSVNIAGDCSDEENTTTDSQGNYFFDNLRDGECIVSLVNSDYGYCGDGSSSITVNISDANPNVTGVDFDLFTIADTPFVTINQGDFTVNSLYSPNIPDGEVTIINDGSVFVSLYDDDFPIGPFNPSLNSVYGYMNYNDSSINFDELFNWISELGGTDLIEFEESDFSIAGQDFSLSDGKEVLMVNGDLTVSPETRNINALLIVNGNVNILEDSNVSDTELVINGGLWVRNDVSNQRTERVLVNSNFSYLNDGAFDGFLENSSRVYWIRFDE